MNLQGCPTAVRTHCYKGFVRPVLQYALVVCDPHQPHQKSTVEMVPQQSACHILCDLSFTSDASALVAQLLIENLQSRRMSAKVCMMHKIIISLVNVKPKADLLEPGNSSCRENRCQLQVLHSRTDSIPAFLLPISKLTLELCPHRCSISSQPVTLPAFRFALTGWME